MRYHLYCLLFPNGKRYFGISNDVQLRLKGHLKCANAGSRLPIHCAIRKYGAPLLQVLCVGSREYIAALEIAAIASFNTRDHTHGYNVTLGGDMSPMHTPVVAAKLSATLCALSKCERRRRVMKAVRASFESAAHAKRLVSIRSPEVRAAKSAKLKGREVSAVTRKKLRTKWRNANYRARVSSAVRVAWQSSELRNAQSARFKGRKLTSEQYAKASETFFKKGHVGYGKGQKRPGIAALISSLRWITNGERGRRITVDTPIPEGWRHGKPHRVVQKTE